MIFPDVTHGTYRGYTTGGCRCAVCRAAARDAKRRQRNPDSPPPAPAANLLPGDWASNAACRETDAQFYPDANPHGGDIPESAWAVEAILICRTCPVSADCLTHALAYEDHGVWAGTLPVDRRRMRHQAHADTRRGLNRPACAQGHPMSRGRRGRSTGDVWICQLCATTARTTTIGAAS